MVSGDCKKICDAAAKVGPARESLSRALRTPHVAEHLRQKVPRHLAIHAARAGTTKTELLDSAAEIVRDRASSFVLGLAGIQPATSPSVNLHIEVKAGHVIDLSVAQHGATSTFGGSLGDTIPGFSYSGFKERRQAAYGDDRIAARRSAPNCNLFLIQESARRLASASASIRAALQALPLAPYISGSASSAKESSAAADRLPERISSSIWVISRTADTGRRALAGLCRPVPSSARSRAVWSQWLTLARKKSSREPSTAEQPDARCAQSRGLT
jgi:hypothetical protein